MSILSVCNSYAAAILFQGIGHRCAHRGWKGHDDDPSDRQGRVDTPWALADQRQKYRYYSQRNQVCTYDAHDVLPEILAKKTFIEIL